MNEILRRIGETGIVPVVVIEDAGAAVNLARALCDGGLPCAEVTLRTGAATDALRVMRENFPRMLLGAGTVLNVAQVDAAICAGAQFIVSPGFDPRIVSYCQSKDITVIPGTSNATDVQMALACDLEAVKFFPAEPLGGLRMIRALAAPFGDIKFMPTGGIHAGNAAEYLACDCVLACGGSWMVKSEWIRDGDFETIKAQVREAATLVRSVRGRTQGIK